MITNLKSFGLPVVSIPPLPIALKPAALKHIPPLFSFDHLSLASQHGRVLK
jgi:hypothetical protein